jgi:hypothetical protein
LMPMHSAFLLMVSPPTGFDLRDREFHCHPGNPDGRPIS